MKIGGMGLCKNGEVVVWWCKSFGSLPEGKPTSWLLCGIAFRSDVKSNLVIQNKRSLPAVIQSLDSGDLRSSDIYQVLDVGCGVASFSAYLLPLDIHTMSFAPKDGHENQIQLALEQEIGIMISALARKQLPYPE
ncbi:probable methyltransferase PMT6 [Tanacetum coccineum]